MVHTRTRQATLARENARQRALSWFAALLVLVASTAFALRPTAGVLAAVHDLEQRDTEITCAYAAHAQHHQHQGSHHQHHAGHCLFCFVPAIASGVASPLRQPERAYTLAPRPAALKVVHATLEPHGHVQSRAPPAT